jgi:hypothetical protein
MAITIATEPEAITSASNPCEFTFSSTATSNDSFSFVVELTVNGTIHSFHQRFLESAQYARFDASEILRNIVFSDMITNGTLSTAYTEAIASYSIRVIEKYGTPPVQVGSWVGSNTVYAINGSLRHNDWINTDFADYDMDSVAVPLFMTYFPRTERHYCGLNESTFLGALSSTGSTSYMEVKLYDSNDVVIFSSLAITLTATRLKVVDVSPSTIIANTSLTSSNFNAAFYYSIRTYVGFASQTEYFKIYIDRECSQYTSRRLHWLNKFGVWDSYSFNKYSEESTDVKSSSYEKELGQWNASNQHDHLVENGQMLNYSKNSKDKMTLNSDWIKQDKQNWLMKSLIESPKVYLETSEGKFEPVKVTTSKFKLKQRIREGLINEKIEIERTYTYQSQLN